MLSHTEARIAGDWICEYGAGLSLYVRLLVWIMATTNEPALHTTSSLQARTFFNFMFSSWPIICMGLIFKDTLMATAVPCYNPGRILAFVWGAAILHDFWFFTFHTMMHKVGVRMKVLRLIVI